MTMKIIAKTDSGNEIELEIEPSTTISEIKRQIMLHTGISAIFFRLFLDGKELENDKTAAEYNIKDGTVILAELHKADASF